MFKYVFIGLFCLWAEAVNFDWLWLLRVQTNNCLKSCVTKYKDSYYCDAESIGYCCSIKSDYKNCINSDENNVSCSKDVPDFDLHYWFCLRDDKKCGKSELIANVTAKAVVTAEVNYSTSDVC